MECKEFQECWECCLCIQLAEQGYTPSDPVALRFIRRNLHHDDEVGGVTGGGQRTATLAGLVHGRLVDHLFGEFRTLQRFQPDLKMEENRPL